MNDDAASSESDDSDAPPEALPTGGTSSNAASSLQRANKNRPAVLSSRQRVSSFRVAPGLEGKQRAGRDPRFNPHGEDDFNAEGWRKSYDFIFEQQREEAREMKRMLSDSQRATRRAKQRGGGAKRQKTRAKVLGTEESAALKLELERTQNRLAADERRAKKQAAKEAVRKAEVAAVQEGKRPYFAKKSEVRERELLAQYEELKKGGKLEKFLAKKRKKLDGKQHKRMPARADA